MMKDLNRQSLDRIKDTLMSEGLQEHRESLRRDYTSRKPHSSAAVYGFRCLKPASRLKMRNEFGSLLDQDVRKKEVEIYLDDLIGK